MPTRLRVLIGPAGCGKTSLALAEYAGGLLRGGPEQAFWLAPNSRSVRGIQGKLIERGASCLLAPGVFTFAGLSAQLLRWSRAPARPIGVSEKRLIVERILDGLQRTGKLRHFAPVARTPGLVDLIAQFIAEWKRLEIWPNEFRAACERRGCSRKDGELADIYEAYQDVLTRYQLFDAEGQIWLARAMLRDGHCRRPEQLRILVADGFSDFTRTEHEVLELLAARADDVLVTLPGEIGGEREDLFAKSARTAEQFRQRNPGCDVVSMPARSDDRWRAMQHLQRRLFGHPRRAEDAPDTAGIELLAAGRELGEMELIAERIKQLLHEGDPERPGGVRPDDIAVVLRSLRRAAPLARETFARYGIPHYIERGVPLHDVPLISALGQLLRLHAEDWPFDTVLALVNQNYFRPHWHVWSPATVADIDSAIRHAQVPRGKDALLAGVRRMATSTARAPREAGDHGPRPRGSAAAALAALERLAATLDELPLSASLNDWRSALNRVALALGFVSQGDDHAASSTRSVGVELNRAARLARQDEQGWTQLNETLALNERIESVLGDKRLYDAREFTRFVQDLAAQISLTPEYDDVGRVRVLSAASARTLEIPYLFVAGLTEGAFPAVESHAGVYRDAESRGLAQAGLPVILREERAQEEMLLFYEIVTRARRRLYLSYAALDDQARPLLPSPYVTEVERAFGRTPITRFVVEDLSPIPAAGAIWSVDAWRIRSVVEAGEGRPGMLAGLLRHPRTATTGRNVISALEVVDERGSGRGFGRFEGMMTSATSVRRLDQRYGEERIWSPTELDQYAACPYQFFLARVLGLAPPPEMELQTDYRRRGGWLHDVLAALHRRLNLSPSARPQSLGEQEYGELVEQLLAEHCSGTSPDDNSVLAALDDVQRRELREWLANYPAQHESYEALTGLGVDWQPHYFEVAFGAVEGPSDDETARDAVSTAECLELREGRAVVRIGGRIDRIDTATVQGRTVFNVLDYKSGRHPSAKAIKSGQALQLPLYALAVERVLLADRRAVPWQVGYWSVSQEGYTSGLQMAHQEQGPPQLTETWRELVARLVSDVHALVRGVRGGHFPVQSRDKLCTSRCEFSTVCRVNQARSLEKEWRPPGAGPGDGASNRLPSRDTEGAREEAR